MSPDASPPLAERLVEENFSVVDGVLCIAGRSVADIAAECGTPAFLYDADILRRAYRQLAQAVGAFADVCYSIKANPNPDVIRVFLAEGAGLEIASAGEFEKALAAGCPPESILFAGPAKTDDELDRVIGAGIGEIHVESEGEIVRLGAIARRRGRTVRVAVRVNPVAAAGGANMLMGGRPSQFGIDEERLAEAIDRVEGEPGLALAGIHLFTGTQILDVEVLRRHWTHGLGIAVRVSRRIGRPLRTVDLGGGLGIPYFANDEALDLSRLAGIAAELAAAARAEPAFSGTRFLVEPGRYLAGPAGLYLTRVIDIKVSRGERFIIVDGGMHHHLAASGNLGQIVKRDFPIVPATRMTSPTAGPAAVVGPLCTPLDVLARQVAFPALEPGDLVAVLQSGAYALSASPVGFLSRPMPAEVLIDDGPPRACGRAGAATGRTHSPAGG